MSTIPTSLTENQFDEYIRPYISVAKRGYECQIPPVQGIQLHSVSLTYWVPMASLTN